MRLGDHAVKSLAATPAVLTGKLKLKLAIDSAAPYPVFELYSDG